MAEIREFHSSPKLLQLRKKSIYHLTKQMIDLMIFRHPWEPSLEIESKDKN